jgi:hypothetical protein
MHRRQLKECEKRAVIDKTDGCCHICGSAIDTRRATNSVFDHVVPLDLGGKDETTNMLLACRRCNGLRWHHHPETIRRILFLGVIANLKGYKRPTSNAEAKAIRTMRARRLVENLNRRAHLSRNDADTLLRRFNRFEDLVAQRIQGRGSGTRRWSEVVEDALNDDDIAPRYKKAYRRLIAHERPGPEERKVLRRDDR